MELVNNRYRVIKNLKQNRQVSAYLVSDMWDENREMQLNILNAEFIPDSLIEYYSSEFISLISLDSEDIVRDYTFNIVSHIDNKRTEEEQYFYTCEYFEDTVDIFEYTGNMDIFEITSVFMELCKAVNYLHLKGYVHGALNPGNILIVKQNDGFKLKLKDLATVELEKNFYPGDNSDDSFFKSPRLLSGKTPHRSADLYSLGIILLALLEKMQGSEIDPKDKLSRLLDELRIII
jgi:serine/threonine protein kinase